MNDLEVSVVLNPLKVVLVDYHSMLVILVPMYILNISHVDILDDHSFRSPSVITVVWFMRSQRYPTNVDTEMYPRHSSWIPRKSDVEEWRAYVNADTGHGRSPIPASSNEHPITVMMCCIAKGLIWNPGIFPVPNCPATYCKWRPCDTDIERTPEVVISSVVTNSVPNPVFI